MTAVGMPATLRGDPKALLFKQVQVLGAGAVLLEIEFRHPPNAIAEVIEDLTLGFDQIPDFRGIFS